MNRRSPHSTWWRDPWLWTNAAVAARHAMGAWRLRQTTAFLSSARLPTDQAGGRGDVPPLHMVVPVLWEQDHVGTALEWFATLLRQLPGSTLTVVTSGREDREREHLVDAVAHCPARLITARRFPHLTAEEIRDLTAHADAAGRAGVASVLSRRPFTRDAVAGVLDRPAFADAPIRHVH
jgi:hypothetical protein